MPSARKRDTEPFVRQGSIVRRVWGDVDLVLLVFAGAAAEFALNRAVDWLFVTGALPQDPLGRFFSTAAHAQRIALGSRAEAEQAMAAIRAAHERVEQRRKARIPDWAHRDVLYLLIDYSARAFEAVHRPLTPAERKELYAVFRRVGEGLGIPELPADHTAWVADRMRHLERDLVYTTHTAELYEAYRRVLGAWRYWLLIRVQGALAPTHVRTLLGLPGAAIVRRLLPLYPTVVRLGLRSAARRALVPRAQMAAVGGLDRVANAGVPTG